MVRRGRSLNWLADQVGINNVDLSKIKNNLSAIAFPPSPPSIAALGLQPGDILEYVDGISRAMLDDANSK